MYKDPFFSTSCPKFISSLFVNIAILTSMRCYLTVVSVCIILMISYDQHLFMCLLTVSLYKNVYEGPLSIYKNKSDCCFAMEWYGFHVYLDMNPFSGKWFAKVFSQPQAVFFTLFIVYCAEAFSLMASWLFILACFPCFWCQIQSNQCHDQCQGDFPPPCLFLETSWFQILYLILWSISS